jgi:hypothetical protein
MGIVDFVLQQLPGKPRISREEQRKALLAKEAAIGGQVFGPVPKGSERAFFYLDNHTWVWNESWKDSSGRQITITTRYEIHGDQIIKIQDGQPYQLATPEESRNLVTAARLYLDRIRREVYTRPA